MKYDAIDFHKKEKSDPDRHGLSNPAERVTMIVEHVRLPMRGTAQPAIDTLHKAVRRPNNG
jgi:hypothetical protein